MSKIAKNPLIKKTAILYHLHPELQADYNKKSAKIGDEAATKEMHQRICDIIERYLYLQGHNVFFRDSEKDAVRSYFTDKEKTVTNILLCSQTLEKRCDEVSRTAGRKLAQMSHPELFSFIDSILYQD